MADDIDRASDMQQVMLDSMIAAQMEKGRQQRETPRAECLNGCGDKPMPGGFFCSQDCASDFEYRKEIRRRQGLA